MYQFGQNNVPCMHSNYGQGSGIHFKMDIDGNDECRWTEQWIPHSARFLQSIIAMVEK